MKQSRRYSAPVSAPAPQASPAAGAARGNAAAAERLAARGSAAVPPQVERALAGPATDLPHRARLEAAFGDDFGKVRVHRGDPVTRAALAGIGAEALAVGDQLLFADASPTVELIAHELAHIVQNRGGASTKAASAPGDSAEQNADAAANAALSGEALPEIAAPTGELQGSWLSDLGSAISTAASGAASRLTGGAAPAATPAPAAASAAPASAQGAPAPATAPAVAPAVTTAAPASTSAGVRSAQQAPASPAAAEKPGAQLLPAFTTGAMGIFDAAIRTAEHCADVVVDRGTALADRIEGVLTEAGGDFTEAVGEARDWVKGGVEEVGNDLEALVETADAAKDRATGFLSGLFSTAVTQAEGLLEATVSTGNSMGTWIGGKVNSLEDSASNWLNDNLWKMGLDPGHTYDELSRSDSMVVTPSAPAPVDANAPKVIFAPGMMTDAEDTAKSAQALADMLGVPVTATSNPAMGFLADLVECGQEKFFGISSTPTVNIENQILDGVLDAPPQKILIYAHSQGSINTAGAIREVEEDLIAEGKANGLSAADAEAWAHDTINELVVVQPVGGAANTDDNSLKTYGNTWDPENPVESEVRFLVESATMPLHATEAIYGDYPSWYTGDLAPIIDPEDAVATGLTGYGEDVRVDTENAGNVGGKDHGFLHYVDSQSDEMKAAYNGAK